MDGGNPTQQRGGGFHGKSSYFSVDVFVDYLEAPRLPCRVPSIGFQFLDFPAITVYSPQAGEIRPGDAQRHSFNQGKSCVFEMVEYDLHERMRREPLRLAWVDSWQLKDKELASAKLPMVTGMDRKVRGRPAHVQQGKYRLHDTAGQPVCTVQLRVSVVTHGNALQPELLKQRDYKTAPRAQHGMRDDWQPIIKRLVTEYHQEATRNGGGIGAGVGDGGVRSSLASPQARDVISTTEQIVRKSESVLAERIDGISRRMAQVQRTNLELTGQLAKLEDQGGTMASVQERVRIAQLEEDNRKLQEQMVEMARLQVTSARGLQPTQVLQAIKFQVAELLKLNPTFDLQAVFDAFDLDGDGVVSTDEFVIGLRELGIALEPTQIPAVLELLPTDSRSGAIGYKTFVGLFGGKEQHVLTDITNQVRHIFTERGLQLKQAFRAMDTNHDGIISKDEFAKGLKALQIDLTPEKLSELLRLVDADVDGMINYYDFVQHFGSAQEGWDWAVTAAVHDQQKRTSLEWAVLRGQNDPVVISPDGWERTDLQRSLLDAITLSTYLRRLNKSETKPKKPTDEREAGGLADEATGLPTDNAVWMREALDPTLRDSDRPYIETDPDQERKKSGSDLGMHRDGFDCPPALMFVNTPTVDDVEAKQKAEVRRQAASAKSMRSSPRRGGRGKGGSMGSPRRGQKSSGKSKARGASREAVLDVLVDQVSYSNSRDHAASYMPRPNGQVSMNAGPVGRSPGQRPSKYNRIGPKSPAGPRRAWESTEEEGSGDDGGAHISQAMLSPPKRAPRSTPRRGTAAASSTPRSVNSPRSSEWAASRASLQVDVTDFLATICPGGTQGRKYAAMYSEALHELGVVEMADLELVEDTDLRGVGVPLIDARRLLRAVKRAVGEAVGGVPAAEYGVAIAAALASFDGSNPRSVAEQQLAATMQKASAAVAAAPQQQQQQQTRLQDSAPPSTRTADRQPAAPAPAPAAVPDTTPAAAPPPAPAPAPASFVQTISTAGSGTGSPPIRRTMTPQDSSAVTSGEPTEADLRAVFTRMDLHRDGQISRAELNKALPASIGDSERKEFEAALQEMEKGSTRQYGVDEFLGYMNRHHHAHKLGSKPAATPVPAPVGAGAARTVAPPSVAAIEAAAVSQMSGAIASMGMSHGNDDHTGVIDGLRETKQPAPAPAPADPSHPQTAPAVSAAAPSPSALERAKEEAAKKGEESPVAKYAREQREAQEKKDAEEAEKKAAVVKKQQEEASAKAEVERKEKEESERLLKLGRELRAKEQAEKDVAKKKIADAAEEKRKELAAEAAAKQAKEDSWKQLQAESAARRGGGASRAQTSATPASAAAVVSDEIDEIVDEVDDDYGDESFDNSVHDSPPPVAKSGAPAPAPSAYMSRTQTAPAASFQKRPEYGVKTLVADDDVCPQATPSARVPGWISEIACDYGA